MAETHYGPGESWLSLKVLQNYSLILDKLRRGKEARSDPCASARPPVSKQAASRQCVGGAYHRVGRGGSSGPDQVAVKVFAVRW